MTQSNAHTDPQLRHDFILLFDVCDGNPNGDPDEEQNEVVAYRCGRLLALLEYAQFRALGSPNTTLVDRFYGAASSAPASVFGLLLKNAQPHLSRLRRDRVGTYNWLQNQLGEIMSGMVEFPTTLNLRDQGLFGLGYYYQRQERFRRRDGASDDVEEDPSNETDEA